MMRLSALFSFIIPICLASARVNEPDTWEAWKRANHKTYNLVHEEKYRKEIWLANAEHVRLHNLRYNQGLETYYTGLNQFSDLTWDEFKMKYLAAIPAKVISPAQGIKFKASRHTSPKSIDWRQEGYVTPVKSQGRCQSSWAFAAIGAVESQYAIATQKSVNMSVQQLIDCSENFGNQGCNSGWMENAYRYMNIYAIESETNYPYIAKKNKTCNHKRLDGLAKVDSYYSVHSGEELLLKHLVAEVGPAAVAINVDAGFMSYAGGIYKSYSCERNDPNYGLLVVGYGKAFDQNFWIMKTSLGEGFGMGGYINLAQDEDNMCGVANYASIPILRTT